MVRRHGDEKGIQLTQGHFLSKCIRSTFYLSFFQRSAVAVIKKATRPGTKKSRLEPTSLKNEAEPAHKT